MSHNADQNGLQGVRGTTSATQVAVKSFSNINRLTVTVYIILYYPFVGHWWPTESDLAVVNNFELVTSFTVFILKVNIGHCTKQTFREKNVQKKLQLREIMRKCLPLV